MGKLFLGTIGLLIAVAVIVSAPDIKRYIAISMM